MKANGQLKHHFWGEYAATIVLVFDSIDSANLAKTGAFSNWDLIEKDVLKFHGSGDALSIEEEKLITHGADPQKLRSLAKSIDYGEPFTITLT